jgi:hypothetical protein
MSDTLGCTAEQGGAALGVWPAYDYAASTAWHGRHLCVLAGGAQHLVQLQGQPSGVPCMECAAK